jgi:spermidine/putrescine transport system permease protein
MLENIIQAHFGKINDWPMGAALSIAMMLIVGLLAFAFAMTTGRVTRRVK